MAKGERCNSKNMKRKTMRNAFKDGNGDVKCDDKQEDEIDNTQHANVLENQATDSSIPRRDGTREREPHKRSKISRSEHTAKKAEAALPVMRKSGIQWKRSGKDVRWMRDNSHKQRTQRLCAAPVADQLGTRYTTRHSYRRSPSFERALAEA